MGTLAPLSLVTIAPHLLPPLSLPPLNPPPPPLLSPPPPYPPLLSSPLAPPLVGLIGRSRNTGASLLVLEFSEFFYFALFF